LGADSEDFIVLIVSVELFRFNVAMLELDAELLVFLCSWLIELEFVSGRTLGRTVITLDVLDRGGSTTGTAITAVAAPSIETGSGGAGVRFSFSVSASISLGVMLEAGRD
jgi:hypothetical protein